MRRLSEYGSVAYLVERPTRETRSEQYSDTVPKEFSDSIATSIARYEKYRYWVSEQTDHFWPQKVEHIVVIFLPLLLRV